MEFFRWVLIILGIALLAATYFLGRRKVDNVDYRRSVADKAFDPSLEDLSVPISGRPSETEAPVYVDRHTNDEFKTEEEFETEEEFNDREFLSDREIDSVIVSKDSYSTEVAMDISGEFDDEIADDQAKPAKRGGIHSVKSLANAVKQASQRNVAPLKRDSASGISQDDFETSLSSEFEPYTEYPEEVEEKLVTVSVTAPRDHIFSGKDLKAAFDNHGYEFGGMSIYHCSHENNKVFSIANMVKPGTFDENNMDAFETSGITLFMRLPVALDADVAFDFLIREATELAEELGGQLRDADRSTLSKQTIQHLREDIQQYLFRQKRAMKANTV